MGIKELAAKVAEKHPDLLTSAQATTVLRTAFEALHEELDTTTETNVKMVPLGHFKLSDKSAKGGEKGEDKDDASGDGKRKIMLRLAREKEAGAKVKPEAAAKRAEKKETREAEKAVRRTTRKEAASAK